MMIGNADVDAAADERLAVGRIARFHLAGALKNGCEYVCGSGRGMDHDEDSRVQISVDTPENTLKRLEPSSGPPDHHQGTRCLGRLSQACILPQHIHFCNGFTAI
jgi:hypothetical protein